MRGPRLAVELPEEETSTENIDIIGKKGKENQAKKYARDREYAKLGEGSKQAFPLLSCARVTFFVRSMAPGQGRRVRPQGGHFYRESLIM